MLGIGLCALLLIVAVDLRSGVHTGLEGTAGFGIGRALGLDTGKTWDASRRM